MGRPQSLAARAKISASRKEHERRKRAMGYSHKVGYAMTDTAQKAAEDARNAANEAAAWAGKAAAYAAARSVGEGTVEPSGAVIAATPVQDKPSPRAILAILRAPVSALETRMAIWLWFLWFVLYLATWFEWLRGKIS